MHLKNAFIFQKKKVDTTTTSWDKCAKEMDLKPSKGFHQQYVLHFADGSCWKIKSKLRAAFLNKTLIGYFKV